jgi:hypothetical protein
MRLYTIHQAAPAEAGGDPKLAAVKEGFCWPALFLTAIWSLWKGLWLVTVVIAAAEMLLGWLIMQSGGDPVVDATLNLALYIVVGLLGNDLRRWTLARRGYDEVAVVAAPDAETALHRFLSMPAPRKAAPNKTASVPASPRASSAPLLPPPAPEPLFPS